MQETFYKPKDIFPINFKSELSPKFKNKTHTYEKLTLDDHKIPRKS